MLGTESIPTGKGRERKYNCPFCVTRLGRADNKFHLYFDPDRSYKGSVGQFVCHRCGVKGSKEKLAKYYEEVAVFNLSDIDTKLARFKYGLSEEDDDEQPNIECPEPTTQEIVSGSLEEEYLVKRGFASVHIDRYKIKAGAGDLLNRIVIPAYDGDTLVYWQARSVIGSVKPKYKNPMMPKQDVIFNKDEAFRFKRIFIMEGPLTAMMGGRDCVCVFGSNVSRALIRILLSGEPEEYVICLDEDAMGKGIDLAEAMKQASPDKGISFYIPPLGLDAADMGFVNFRESLKRRLVPFESVLDKVKIKLKTMELNRAFYEI